MKLTKLLSDRTALDFILGDVTPEQVYAMSEVIFRLAKNRGLLVDEPHEEPRRCRFGHWEQLPRRCEIPTHLKTFIRPDRSHYDIVIEDLPDEIENTTTSEKKRENSVKITIEAGASQCVKKECLNYLLN